jgi:hypothetical protein
MWTLLAPSFMAFSMLQQSAMILFDRAFFESV